VSRWFPEHFTLHVTAADSLAAVEGGESLRLRTLDLAASTFEHQLNALKPARHAQVSCVFAGDLVRYCVVPWNPGTFRAASRQSFAQHCFKEIYGDAAANWTVRLDEPRYDRPTLACAIDTTLLGRLATLAASRGLVLESLQPSLMQAARAARGTVQSQTFWLVVQEPRVMTLLLVVEQRPHLVKVLAAREHNLGIVLAREWLALGLESARCPIVHVSPQMPAAPLIEGWKVRVLGGQSGNSDRVSGRAQLSALKGLSA
jgi:hypothetical protein